MKDRAMWRYSSSTTLRLRVLALGLALYAAAAAASPDPVRYGVVLEMGDIEQVREWLDAGLDPDTVADRIGTGLMIAAWRGDIPMMELLVARGADVDKLNELGERALMHAAWRGQLEAVRWLLAKGARVNSEPQHWSALHYAVFAGHGEVAGLLLEHGADVNARSTNGSSVLMMAVYEDREDLVRKLLARGADPAIRNDRDDGALEWAFKFKRLAIARLVATPREFAAAANQPAAQWGDPVRSQPESTPSPGGAADPAGTLTRQIEELLDMRRILAERGMTGAVSTVDRRIAALRVQRVRAEGGLPPAAVLEISARRASPAEQETRLIFEP